MREKLFKDAGAGDAILWQKLGGFLGEVDEDGSALGQHKAVNDQD